MKDVEGQDKIKMISALGGYGAISLNGELDSTIMLLTRSSEGGGALIMKDVEGHDKIQMISDPDGYGALYMYGNSGKMAELIENGAGAGKFTLYDSLGSANVSLTSDSGTSGGLLLQGNSGNLLFLDASADQTARLYTNSISNSGELRFWGPNNLQNIVLGYTAGSDGNHGWMGAFNQNQLAAARMYSSNTHNGAGQMHTNGPNGNFNTYVGALDTDNHGFISVSDASNNSKAHLYIFPNGTGVVESNILRTLDMKATMFTDINGDGTIQADVKNFSMPHPVLEDKRIVYACIEGPEAAAYARGTGRLQNGRAIIELPDHFVLVASEEGMTVTLTPLSAQSKGLAVTRKSLDGIEVQEMFEGAGNYEFDWEVKSIRKGYENYEVVRDRINLDMMHLQPSVQSVQLKGATMGKGQD